jgi:hypothetical protein
MQEKLRFQLGNPLLVFIWSFSMLLIGGTIGAHWRPSRTDVFFMAISGAVLAAIHDLCQAFLVCALTAWWIGTRHAGGS